MIQFRTFLLLAAEKLIQKRSKRLTKNEIKSMRKKLKAPNCRRRRLADKMPTSRKLLGSVKYYAQN